MTMFLAMFLAMLRNPNTSMLAMFLAMLANNVTILILYEMLTMFCRMGREYIIVSYVFCKHYLVGLEKIHMSQNKILSCMSTSKTLIENRIYQV